MQLKLSCTFEPGVQLENQFVLKFVGSNAAEIELHFEPGLQNSNKFVLKFVSSNAA